MASKYPMMSSGWVGSNLSCMGELDLEPDAVGAARIPGLIEQRFGLFRVILILTLAPHPATLHMAKPNACLRFWRINPYGAGLPRPLK